MLAVENTRPSAVKAAIINSNTSKANLLPTLARARRFFIVITTRYPDP